MGYPKKKRYLQIDSNLTLLDALKIFKKDNVIYQKDLNCLIWS